MPYRNDRDADLARIDALETELAGAQQRIQELKAQPRITVERVIERVVERERTTEPHDVPAVRARPQPRSPAAPPAIRAPGPYRAQATTVHEHGRMIREYVFDRALPLEECRQLVRTLGERLDRRGRIEIHAQSAAWIAGGRRIGVALRDGITVLTCIDAHVRRAWLGSTMLASTLVVLCCVVPHAAMIAASAIVAILLWLIAILFASTRKEAASELFERVAGMLGAELPERGGSGGSGVDHGKLDGAASRRS